MTKKVMICTMVAMLIASVLARTATDEAKLYTELRQQGKVKPYTEPPQQGKSKKCSNFCNRDYVPVCGSDGVTYGNKCVFEYASCMNSTISKASDGECPILK